MFRMRCPYCKELIRRDALVCRYCNREVEPERNGDSCTAGVLFGLIGLAAGAVSALAWGYYNERRRWHDEGHLDFSTGEESFD